MVLRSCRGTETVQNCPTVGPNRQTVLGGGYFDALPGPWPSGNGNPTGFGTFPPAPHPPSDVLANDSASFGISSSVGSTIGNVLTFSLIMVLLVQIIFGLGNPQPSSVKRFYTITVVFFAIFQVAITKGEHGGRSV